MNQPSLSYLKTKSAMRLKAGKSRHFILPRPVVLGSTPSKKGHGDAEVTHSPPTSEVYGSNPKAYAGNFLVAYQWLAVYSTEP